jgi:hypothetical protein
MSNLKRGPYIDASYHVSVHLATQLQRRWFLRNTKNKNWRWWWRLLTDRDKMGKLHRGPSVYAFCPDSVHLAKRFQRRKFKCIKLTDDGRRKTDVMAKAYIAFRNLDWDFCLSCCLWQINVLDCVSFVWIHIVGHVHLINIYMTSHCELSIHM